MTCPLCLISNKLSGWRFFIDEDMHLKVDTQPHLHNRNWRESPKRAAACIFKSSKESSEQAVEKAKLNSRCCFQAGARTMPRLLLTLQLCSPQHLPGQALTHPRSIPTHKREGWRHRHKQRKHEQTQRLLVGMWELFHTVWEPVNQQQSSTKAVSPLGTAKPAICSQPCISCG